MAVAQAHRSIVYLCAQAITEIILWWPIEYTLILCVVAIEWLWPTEDTHKYSMLWPRGGHREI